jgi:hypothetical protein
MAISLPHIIDCTNPNDLLANWPVATLVQASDTAICLAVDLDGWLLQGADLEDRPYEIDTDNRIITVNNDGLADVAIGRSRYFQNTLTLRSFAALRAAWQSERVDDALDMHRIDIWPLLTRIAEADIAAMTVRMVHETRHDFDDSLWHHALGEKDGDIALSYARVLPAAPKVLGDMPALATSFLQWFERAGRVRKCDFETLAEMDAAISTLNFEGSGTLSEGAIKCLTIDPIGGQSYLGPRAAEIAGNPAWRSITDDVAQAHFAQIIGDIGAVRVAGLAIRDKKLAARLFPDQLVQA